MLSFEEGGPIGADEGYADSGLPHIPRCDDYVFLRYFTMAMPVVIAANSSANMEVEPTIRQYTKNVDALISMNIRVFHTIQLGHHKAPN